jgi:hypothetical protein
MYARSVAAALALALVCAPAHAQTENPPTPPARTEVQQAPASINPPPGGTSFIPIPEIDADPYAGTTFGLLGVWLESDERNEIHQIIAPDVIHNPNFGWGARGRILAFPSANTQWSIVGGAKQKIESEFDAEYAAGLLRQDRWSFSASAIYDRSGSPRFFGIGNESPLSDQTNYINQQKVLRASIGLNFTREWQLSYTARIRVVKIRPGHLPGTEPIDEGFPFIYSQADRREVLNRVSLAYDTRDDITIPSKGALLVAYIGAASDTGLFNANLYSEAGFDGRYFLPLGSRGTLAAHLAIRYMPTTHNVPFWALSAIGGNVVQIGGDQPLRGFGAGRYRDRNSFSTTLEYRRRVFGVDAFRTRIDVELAPFIDAASVFRHTTDSALSDLHHVYGIGFRGIASPFVVGYVDVGHGSEGTVVFSGISYPF